MSARSPTFANSRAKPAKAGRLVIAPVAESRPASIRARMARLMPVVRAKSSAQRIRRRMGEFGTPAGFSQPAFIGDEAD